MNIRLPYAACLLCIFRPQASASSAGPASCQDEVSFIQHSLKYHSTHAAAPQSISAEKTNLPRRAKAAPSVDRWKALNDLTEPVSYDDLSNLRIQSKSPYIVTLWGALDTIVISSTVILLVSFDFFIVPFIQCNMRNHLLVLVFMLAISALFCTFVWQQHGRTAGEAWATGFLMEGAMSIDNLFGFQLVFRSFAVPAAVANRAMTLGIYIAMLFRVALFVSLAAILKVTHWINVVVGCWLLVTAFASLGDEDQTEEVQSLSSVQFFKWLLGSRLKDTYGEEGGLCTRDRRGNVQMTVLFLVVCVIPFVDFTFSFDNVTTQTAQINSNYINLTSCILAMYALRSCFFIVSDLSEYFEYTKYGISAILFFVGVEMIMSEWYQIPLRYVLLVIGGLFSVSVMVSVIKVMLSKPKKRAKDAESSEETSPARAG